MFNTLTMSWRTFMNHHHLQANFSGILFQTVSSALGIVKLSPRLCYHPDFLKQINGTGSLTRTISSTLRHRLKELQIISNFRGCRGGKAIKGKSCNFQKLNIHTRVTHRDLEINFNNNTYLPSASVNHSNLILIKPLQNTFASNLQFGLWNGQSIREKTASVCDLVISTKLDILAITESWLRGNNADNCIAADIEETLQGFTLFSKPRQDRNGGGIALVIRKDFNIKQNECFNFRSMEYTDLTISSTNNSNFRLVVVYRLDRIKKTKVPISVFFDEFLTLMESFNLESGNVLLCGDFNIHVDLPNSPTPKKFLDIISSLGLHQHVSKSTHRHGHTLDLLITKNGSDFLSNLQHCHDLPSDHDALVCALNTPRPTPCRKLLTFRQTKNLDLKLLVEDLRSSSLFSLSTSNLENMVTNYELTLKTLTDKHAPLKSRYITCRPKAPWYNDNLHQLKVTKRRLERKWISSCLEVDRQIYRKHCQIYTRALNSSKTNYYSSQISTANQKQVFQFVNKLSNVQSAKIVPTKWDKQLSLPEAFSNFFRDKISSLLDGEPLPPTSNVLVESSNCPTTFPAFAPLLSDQLKNVISRSPTKTCPLDPIPTFLLKNVFETVQPVLLQILNTSLATGIFPTQFKNALVYPLIKKPSLNPEVFSNYRPISNLPFISKVLERVVAEQLNRYLNGNTLFTKMQSAYKKNHSVETALVRVSNDLLRALDSKKEAILVLLDLSSAFDTVNHDILLNRLRVRFGITGCALEWFESYLKGRIQTVIIGDEKSSACSVLRGVPQGSVLGPLLFTLYISPIEELILSYNLHPMFYADDTQIFIFFERSERQQNVLNLETCVADLKTWFRNNDLLLNDSKTEVIHITSKFNSNQDPLQSFSVGNTTITSSKSARDLGVILDSHLTLESHISQVCKSSTNAIRLIGRVRKYLNQKQAESLIHAFVISRLDNCNSLFFGLPEYQLKKLQLIQNTAARLVTIKKKREHITPVLKQLHWLPIQQRIQYKILLLTYKALNGSSPVYISELLSYSNPNRLLRSSNKCLLQVPASRTSSHGDRAFSISAPRLWNTLPLDIKKAESVQTFKKLLKTHLFKIYFNV